MWQQRTGGFEGEQTVLILPLSRSRCQTRCDTQPRRLGPRGSKSAHAFGLGPVPAACLQAPIASRDVIISLLNPLINIRKGALTPVRQGE